MVSSSVPVTPRSPACTLVVHGVELILSPSCSEWFGAVVARMARCAGWLALAQCALCRKEVQRTKGASGGAHGEDQDDLNQLPTQVDTMRAPATTRTESHLGDRGASGRRAWLCDSCRTRIVMLLARVTGFRCDVGLHRRAEGCEIRQRSRRLYVRR